MAKRDIVVIGASAGGMDALQKLVRQLPSELPASLFVVWHTGPVARSVLPEVLTRSGALRASHPGDGDPVEQRRIYVAPPDHHLLLEKGFMRVTRGPKENRFRPAADPLFRSAAYNYGSRVIGIVLSGALDDGTSGLWTVKLKGGFAIAQDPSDALHRSMPLNALQQVGVDYKGTAEEIGRRLESLVQENAPAAPAVPEAVQRRLEHEVRIAEESEGLEENVMKHGTLTPYTCPECHGVLTRLTESGIERFRCHTGHAYSANALLATSTEQLEERLWDAVRAVDEIVLLLNHMGEKFSHDGDMLAAERCFDRAKDVHRRVEPVREMALQNERMSVQTLEEDEPVDNS